MAKRLLIENNSTISSSPCSVAVIGASNRIGTWDAGILTRLLGNPERKVYPVNLTSSEEGIQEDYRDPGPGGVCRPLSGPDRNP